MIAVDTSALISILLEEPGWEARYQIMRTERAIVISAATLTEALIVASRRGVGQEMTGLIDRIGFTVVPLDVAAARRAADAYDKWGKGVHPAALTFGDCFAYEVAKQHGCPLLYVGNDFSKTDIVSAL